MEIAGESAIISRLLGDTTLSSCPFVFLSCEPVTNNDQSQLWKSVSTVEQLNFTMGGETVL